MSEPECKEMTTTYAVPEHGGNRHAQAPSIREPIDHRRNDMLSYC